MQRLDTHSAETLRLMVAYIIDDHKIAAHIGIDIRHVAAARRRVRKSCEVRAMQHQDIARECPVDAPDRWERELRRASLQLAEAIAQARLG